MAAVADRLARPPRLVRADLSTTIGTLELVDLIERDLPDLALLVNNAGYIRPGDADRLDPEELDRHLSVNLAAPMHLTSAAARVMRPKGRGDILTIVSLGGILALRGSAAYAASKFGLRGFQTSVRSELAPHGIRVMGIFPAGVDTPMLRYEATHDGSPLNFVSKVITAEAVADACMRALDTGRLETYVPYGDSISTRLAGAFPWLIDRLEPLLGRLGERGRRRFLEERGLVPVHS